MLDHTRIGVDVVSERTWTSRDALLYALGVGAGQEDPGAELAFTTENSEGVAQAVLPTYGVIHAWPKAVEQLGDIDQRMVLHGEQRITLLQALPVSGTVVTTSRAVSIFDKRSGAVVVIDSESVDRATGATLVESRTSVFIRGEGGFGGDRGPSNSWVRPDGPPDIEFVQTTRRDQALIYRLSGDRNPLHSDSTFAAAAGFSRPILHGLATYGFVGRGLLAAYGDSDPARLKSLSVRFAAPVFPGESLRTLSWADGDTVRFVTETDNGVVLDQGVAELAGVAG